MNNNTNFAGINAKLLANAKSVLKGWFPNGTMQGVEFRVGNLRGDKGTSLSVNTAEGTWGDFATNQTGADLIDLYVAIHGCSLQKAAHDLGGTALAADDWKPPIETADETSIIPEGTKVPIVSAKGEYKTSWNYRDANGKLVAVIQRYNIPDGKNIVPWRWIKGKLVSKHLPKPRPLYNIPEIMARPDATVVITEGEKCADVMKGYFGDYVSTTWMQGTAGVAHADWTPLRGRKRVIIVPDADKPGWDAALAIVPILERLGVTDIQIADTTDKPKGWDVADAADEGIPSPEIAVYIKRKLMPASEFRKVIYKPDEPFVPMDSSQYPMREDVPPMDDMGVSGAAEHAMKHNGFFRFLGVNGLFFHFYKYKTSQIIAMNVEEMGKESSLVMLADKDYWDNEMGCQGKYAFMRDTLVRISERLRFDPRLVRRVGVWKDEAGDVVHLGDRLMTKDGIIPISTFETKHIYEYAEHTIRIPHYCPPLPREESRKIIECCAGSYWSDPIAPRILAGWIFTSLICASIRWRSHLYLVGPAGSGKSWLMNNVISKVLGDFACQAISSSTEASIRQGLKNNMIPVIFDEAEAKDAQAGMRREAIFELARQASSSQENTPITKGGAGGVTKDYFVRSPFLFASINAEMEYADESRTTFLYLRPITKTTEVRQKFRTHETFVKNTLTPEFNAGLMARALKLLPLMEQGYEIFSDAAYATIAQDSRHAEQMSFMIVGLWFLENDTLPSKEQAIQFVTSMAYMSNQRRNTMTTEERLIASISQCVVKYRLPNGIVEERIMGELIKTAYFDQGIGMGTAEMVLRRYGLMTNGNRLFVCSNAENLKKSLRNTPFFAGWDKVIVNVMGAKDEGTQTFAPGVVGQTISIPLKSIMGEVNQEKEVL